VRRRGGAALIRREVFSGERRFNDTLRGVPLISRSLLERPTHAG
jgi:hypothetical protein